MQCGSQLRPWEAHLKPGRHAVHHDDLLGPLEVAAMGSQNADCSSHHTALSNSLRTACSPYKAGRQCTALLPHPTLTWGRCQRCTGAEQ